MSLTTCKKCEGNGLIFKPSISLLQICTKCNGYGELDWIENIMQSRHDIKEGMIHTVAVRNIQLLSEKIKEILSELGHHDVRVSIDVQYNVHHNSFNIDYQSLMRF